MSIAYFQHYLLKELAGYQQYRPGIYSKYRNEISYSKKSYFCRTNAMEKII